MSHDHSIEDALKQLDKHGYKHTKKRETMLTNLIDRDGYLSAREMFELLKPIFPTISYDTVYRNLHDFSVINLVEETEINGEMKFKYQCGGGHIGHHHHFICTKCGASREIEMCPMDFFKDRLPGCQIKSHRFEIFGLCEKCATS